MLSIHANNHLTTTIAQSCGWSASLPHHTKQDVLKECSMLVSIEVFFIPLKIKLYCELIQTRSFKQGEHELFST